MVKKNILIQLPQVHYEDVFHITVQRNRLTFDDIREAFENVKSPWWLDALFTVRDFIVKWFGIRTRDDHKPSDETLGLFPILAKTDSEVTLGEDDRHLNFRVLLKVVCVSNGLYDVSFKTLVQFNNNFGRLYFLPVKPLHKIIVPDILRRVVAGLPKSEPLR
jgi:hypothetical protein